MITYQEVNVILKKYSVRKFKKSLLIRVAEMLADDEAIQDYVYSAGNKDSYNVILTNKRIIMLKKTLFGLTHIATPIEKISSIGYKKGIFDGTLIIWNNSGTRMDLPGIVKNKVIPFSDSVNKQINNYKTIKYEQKINIEENVISQLERLTDLYKAGALTEYEFAIKKKELLDKKS